MSTMNNFLKIKTKTFLTNKINSKTCTLCEKEQLNNSTMNTMMILGHTYRKTISSSSDCSVTIISVLTNLSFYWRWVLGIYVSYRLYSNAPDELHTDLGCHLAINMVDIIRIRLVRTIPNMVSSNIFPVRLLCFSVMWSLIQWRMDCGRNAVLIYLYRGSLISPSAVVKWQQQ